MSKSFKQVRGSSAIKFPVDYMFTAKRSTSPSYNIGNRFIKPEETSCKHNRKYLNKFLTFQYWYCPDCKEEIDENDSVVKSDKESKKETKSSIVKKEVREKGNTKLNEDDLLREFERMLGQSYYEDTEDDEDFWFTD